MLHLALQNAGILFDVKHLIKSQMCLSCLDHPENRLHRPGLLCSRPQAALSIAKKSPIVPNHYFKVYSHLSMRAKKIMLV